MLRKVSNELLGGSESECGGGDGYMFLMGFCVDSSHVIKVIPRLGELFADFQPISRCHMRSECICSGKVYLI